MLVAVKNCLTRLAVKWQGVVERNGALQLAFGLVFGVGSGRWRLACWILTGVQLLGLVGVFMTMYNFAERPEGPTPAPHLKITSIVLRVIGLAFPVGYLVTYTSALHYIHKYGFVANVGMLFPCAPLSLDDFQPSSASRLNAEAQLSSAAEEDVENAPMNSGHDEECQRPKSDHKLRQSKIKVAVSVLCVFVLLELPILLAITYITRIWDVPILRGNQILNTFMSLQLIIGPSADVIYSLLFVLVTNIVVRQISDTRCQFPFPDILASHGLT